MNKMMTLMMSLLLIIGLLTTPAYAAGTAPTPAPEEPERDCLPEESFTRYFFASPDELMPDVETTQADISWNYQCAHEDNSVEVIDSNGSVVKTIQSGGAFGKGDNHVFWDGLDDNGKPVKDGIYTIVITPLDEFAQFAMQIPVKIRLMKYPTIYGIFGDELKEKVKELP